MTKPPSAVLFDLDGVLVRSEGIWFRVVAESIRRFGGRPITREEFDTTFGQGTEADITQFGLRCSVEELNRFYAESFTRHLDQIWLDPEARPLIERLAGLGMRLAVVTNTTTPLAEDILRIAGLRDFFHRVACADQVPHPKPAPDVVEHAMQGLGVRAAEAWMVGDSRYDRAAARAAGVYFVGLGQDGDARIERLTGLVPLIERASQT